MHQNQVQNQVQGSWRCASSMYHIHPYLRQSNQMGCVTALPILAQKPKPVMYDMSRETKDIWGNPTRVAGTWRTAGGRDSLELYLEVCHNTVTCLEDFC